MAQNSRAQKYFARIKKNAVVAAWNADLLRRFPNLKMVEAQTGGLAVKGKIIHEIK